MTQSEVRVTEVSVPLDVMKRLPDQTLLLQEALIRHQQVQVTLRDNKTLLTTATWTTDFACRHYSGMENGHLVCVCVCVWLHLVFDHGTEVVVSEEHGDFSLFGRRVELTQTVIRQLGRRRLQELLRHQTWGVHTQIHTGDTHKHTQRDTQRQKDTHIHTQGSVCSYTA